MEDMTLLSLQEVHFSKCLPSIVEKSIKSRKTVAIRGEMFTREELALKFVFKNFMQHVFRLDFWVTRQ